MRVVFGAAVFSFGLIELTVPCIYIEREIRALKNIPVYHQSARALIFPSALTFLNFLNKVNV